MSAAMPIRQTIANLWDDLTSAEKFVAIALIALIGIVIGVSWWNTFRAWNETRQFENQAVKANQEKDEALADVAKIAGQVKIREEELAKVEAKRDAKKDEVKAADNAVSRDRDEYERAVRQRTPWTAAPSTDDLCKRLADSGHPCR